MNYTNTTPTPTEILDAHFKMRTFGAGAITANKIAASAIKASTMSEQIAQLTPEDIAHLRAALNTTRSL